MWCSQKCLAMAHQQFCFQKIKNFKFHNNYFKFNQFFNSILKLFDIFKFLIFKTNKAFAIMERPFVELPVEENGEKPAKTKLRENISRKIFFCVALFLGGVIFGVALRDLNLQYFLKFKNNFHEKLFHIYIIYFKFSLN